MEKKPELEFENEQLTVTIPSLIGILTHLLLVTAVVVSLKLTHNISNMLDHIFIISLIIAEFFFTMGCLNTRIIYDLNAKAVKILDEFLGKDRVVPINEVKDIRAIRTPFLISSSTVTIETNNKKRLSIYLVDSYFANKFVKTVQGIIQKEREEKS